MPEQITMTDPYAGFPREGVRFYGVPTYELGEEGAEVLAAGHGRRSYAALARALRGDEAPYNTWDRRSDFRPSKGDGWTISVEWTLFVDDCGCSAADHARHVANDEDCSEHCKRRGMAPCARYPEFAWYAEKCAESAPGALPVLRVSL